MSTQRSGSSGGDTAIVWLRGDLRLHDHPAFAAAGSYAQLLPVFVFAPRLFGTTEFGFRKVGPYRAQFLLQSLVELRDALRERGSDLLLFRAEPARILAPLAQRIGAAAIWYQDEPGTEESVEVGALERALAASGAAAGSAPTQLVAHHGATLFHPDDLPFTPAQMPNVYSEFRRAAERHSAVRQPTAAPDRLPPLPPDLPGASHATAARDSVADGQLPAPIELPSVQELSGAPPQAADPRAALQFSGGESAGLARLRYYLWESDKLRRYRSTRNGLLGADYSSKFSPWLAHGCLSPRTIFAEVKRYEQERVKNDSTYWLGFELIWRDYFAYLARKYPAAIFRIDGPMQRRMEWNDDWETFDRWRRGATGDAFIDANMREIAATGYMSNRGRQNVASYLARDLKVNWLMGAEWFEHLLVDYDPASNYGNWTYTVGVGTDPRRDRYFNPVTQAAKYDPDGRYRAHWLEADT